MAIESQLKQRLVGIAVIVSLAVIFLPMLLDGAGVVEKTEFKESRFEIPPPPKVERRSIDLSAKAKQLKKRISRIPVVSQNIVDASNKKQDKAEKLTPKKTSIKNIKKPIKKVKKVGGESWIAQLGSFVDQDKAFKLQDKVRAYKIASVFIQKVVIKSNKSYRVRMGPFLYQKQAKAAVKKLSSKYKIKAVVMKHDQ